MKKIENAGYQWIEATEDEIRERVQHTPGPWLVGSSEDADYMGDMSLGGLYVQQTTGCNSVICELDRITENRHANARLIAAAPDMFQALQELAEGEWDQTLSAFEVQQAAREIARKAYLKALGLKG